MYSKAELAFYDAMWPLAQVASGQTHIFAEIIYAQSALESGYGLHAPGHNYFGIKSTVANGLNTIQATAEYIAGKWRTERDSFSGYRSMAASVQGYVNFITRYKRYVAFRGGRTIDDQLAALQVSGYATDPQYAVKLKAIIEEIPHETAAAPAPAPTVKGSSPMSINLLKILEGAGGVIKALVDIAPVPAIARTAVDDVLGGIDTIVTHGNAAVATGNVAAPVAPPGSVIVPAEQAPTVAPPTTETFAQSELKVATDAFAEFLPLLLQDIAAGKLSPELEVEHAEQSFADAVERDGLSMSATIDPTKN